jgi:hypothetical protein
MSKEGQKVSGFNPLSGPGERRSGISYFSRCNSWFIQVHHQAILQRRGA